MTHGFDYDYLVLGAGSGGVRSARVAATRHKAKVAIIEGVRVGGTCVLRGCVPKKLLVYGSHFAHELELARSFGWDFPAEPRLDWGRLIAAKNRELDRLEGVYRTLLKDCALIEGWGRLTGPHEATVTLPGGGARVLTADKILIATGGAPTRIDIPGAERAITSDEALDLPTLPRRIAVLGSGYIAVEFAGIFAAAGAETHLVYRADLPLRGFDQDLRVRLAAEMVKKGVILHPGVNPKAIRVDGDGAALDLDDGSTLALDRVMMATGRKPLTDGIGLEALGIATGRNGAILVDERYATSVPNIFAIGDVTDRINLTPVAIQEGHALADHLFGTRDWTMERDFVPTAVFSQPPLGVVGLTEAEAAAARDAHGVVDVYESEFTPMKHSFVDLPRPEREKTYFKLLVARGSDKVLGCHMMGFEAPEILQIVATALKLGATKLDFDRTVGIHPTAAEELVTMREPAREARVA